MSHRDTEEGMQTMRDQDRLLKSSNPSSITSNPLSAPQRQPPRPCALKKQDRKIAGAIALMGGCAIVNFPNRSLAQSNIVPDATLGAESSFVVPNFNSLPVEAIGGGAVRGQNLFHSFQEFDVSDGRGAYFFSPNAAIQNILARVTGNNPSQILGTLGTFGNSNPNLFLINPNGIIFGQNASLNVGGSFVASTANSVVFDNGYQFSVTNPQAPPLLTVTVPLGLQYGSNTGNIQVQGSLLQVPNGKTLMLVGGNVQLDDAGLGALGGRVELAGVGDTGTVGLSENGNQLSLSFPVEVPRADVSLINGAGVSVRAGGGGSIAINARSLDLAGGSELLAGIASGRGSINSKAGDIEINATQAINLTDDSYIANLVRAGGVGKAGDINITTGSLSLTKGAQLDTSTFGRGDAGSVHITAHDSVSVDGVVGRNGIPGAVFSEVVKNAVGNGGSIYITTGSLKVTNGAGLVASTRGQGDAGSVNIIARDTVSFDEESAASSTVEVGAMGKGGSVNITTGSLRVTNGAQLQTSTDGWGDAGSVNITARDRVSLDGVGSNGFLSAVFSYVAETARGKGGNVNITTDSLSLTNGAQLKAGTFGRGDAGNVNIIARSTVSFDGESVAFSTVEPEAVGNGGDVNITTGSFSLTNGAQLQAATKGQGDAGNVNITARDTVSLDGAGSAAFSSVEENAVGKGGNINITTGSLRVTNTAQLNTITKGRGDAGNVNINVRDTVSLDGSAVLSTVQKTAEGKGGNVNITTRSLSLTNGAQLDTSTFGRGDAGSVNITARDTVSFDGVHSNGIRSGVVSTLEPGAVGKGGSINITTDSLSVTNRAGVSVSSFGQGDAGDINITARDLLLNKEAIIQARTRSGNGGNITLNVQDLLLMRRNSLISTTAGTAQQGGDGGNMNINAQFIVAVPKENSDITANAYTGRGGNINITTQGIYGLQFRPRLTPLSDITASSDFGIAGIVNINTPGVDPSRGLSELPSDIVDATRQIDRRCTPAAADQKSSFVVTGRGGLPPNPNEVLQGESVITNWITLNSKAENTSSVTPQTNLTPSTPKQLVEAQTWVYGANGEVILTAQAPTVTPHNSWSTSPSCDAVRKGEGVFNAEER